jgi:hypothetical protein
MLIGRSSSAMTDFIKIFFLVQRFDNAVAGARPLSGIATN